MDTGGFALATDRSCKLRTVAIYVILKLNQNDYIMPRLPRLIFDLKGRCCAIWSFRHFSSLYKRQVLSFNAIIVYTFVGFCQFNLIL